MTSLKSLPFYLKLGVHPKCAYKSERREYGVTIEYTVALFTISRNSKIILIYLDCNSLVKSFSILEDSRLA